MNYVNESLQMLSMKNDLSQNLHLIFTELLGEIKTQNMQSYLNIFIMNYMRLVVVQNYYGANPCIPDGFILVGVHTIPVR